MNLSRLKHCLTEQQKHWLKNAFSRFQLVVIRLVAHSQLSAGLFFALFSREFGREHKAVLQGRLAYQQSLSEIGQSSALIRRNIHRLEKGLIMQPRRAVFAADYIAETVEMFDKAVQQNTLCSEELKWARDVLTDYFAVVTDTPVIAKARALFVAANSELPSAENFETFSVPYPAKELPECPVSFDALYTLYQRRRSVRWFLPQAVKPELIHQAVNAASLAPSACNRQPYRFDLLSQAKDAARVAGLAMGTTGFAEQVPCLLVVIGDLSCYPAERDRHVIYIDSSLAAMQLMLALEALGLSSCPINWPDIESREQAMAETLGLKDYERVVMLIAVGYANPEGGIPYSQKKTNVLLVRELELGQR